MSITDEVREFLNSELVRKTFPNRNFENELDKEPFPNISPREIERAIRWGLDILRIVRNGDELDERLVMFFREDRGKAEHSTEFYRELDEDLRRADALVNRLNEKYRKASLKKIIEFCNSLNQKHHL